MLSKTLSLISVSVLTLAFFADQAASAQAVQSVDSAYRNAAHETEALENVLLLYLRIAGAIWIVLEWIAVYFLWRGYGHLRRFIKEREVTP